MRLITLFNHSPPHYSLFFFFNDTATTEIYTLSLHDALPIWSAHECGGGSRSSAIFFWFTANATVRSVTPCHRFSGCLKRAGIACDSLAAYASSSPFAAAPVR